MAKPHKKWGKNQLALSCLSSPKFLDVVQAEFVCRFIEQPKWSMVEMEGILVWQRGLMPWMIETQRPLRRLFARWWEGFLAAENSCYHGGSHHLKGVSRIIIARVRRKLLVLELQVASQELITCDQLDDSGRSPWIGCSIKASMVINGNRNRCSMVGREERLGRFMGQATKTDGIAMRIN